jgi:GLPGLI family protein
VYVFAFYTDDIMISGGPCSINGLPGMILGLTIPRLYTSFIATKVAVKKVTATEIIPVKAKKNVYCKRIKNHINRGYKRLVLVWR